MTVQIDNQPAGLMAIADALKRNSAAAVAAASGVEYSIGDAHR